VGGIANVDQRPHPQDNITNKHPYNGIIPGNYKRPRNNIVQTNDHVEKGPKDENQQREVKGRIQNLRCVQHLFVRLEKMVTALSDFDHKLLHPCRQDQHKCRELHLA